MFNDDGDRHLALISKYDQPENDVKGKNKINKMKTFKDD